MRLSPYCRSFLGSLSLVLLVGCGGGEGKGGEASKDLPQEVSEGAKDLFEEVEGLKAGTDPAETSFDPNSVFGYWEEPDGDLVKFELTQVTLATKDLCKDGSNVKFQVVHNVAKIQTVQAGTVTLTSNGTIPLTQCGGADDNWQMGETLIKFLVVDGIMYDIQDGAAHPVANKLFDLQ